MFNPNYRITKYLLDCLERIAGEITLIKNKSVDVLIKTNLESEAVNRSVHSSTKIEGNELSLAQVQALGAHQNIIANKNQKMEVENYHEALRFIIKNRKRPFTERNLLNIHKLISKNLLASNRSGKYRTIQNYIVNAKNIRIFTPPAPDNVAKRMTNLFRWLKNADDVHPVIRSAIFHHEFVTIHPFIDGNGRAARAASQWLLFKKNYEPAFTLGIDEFFANDRDRYYEKIQQARELDGDYTYWVEYVAEGLLDSTRNITSRLKAKTLQFKRKNIALTPKQEELLKILNTKHLGSTQISKLMNINRARVNQLINPLVKSGLVVKDGKTRGARYRLV